MAWLLVGLMLILPAGGASAEGKRLFAIPPIQWDLEMARDRPAQIHGASDLANLTGGIVFGLSPSDVNVRLPTPQPGLEWAGLPSATEYPDDVRYFWVRFDAMRDLSAGVTSCVGANSYVVFMFRTRGLFRISWRLLADAACASPRAAAEEIYGRFLAIDMAAAIATHYRPGKAEAVEVTDPNAGYLIPFRWDNRQRR